MEDNDGVELMWFQKDNSLIDVFQMTGMYEILGWKFSGYFDLFPIPAYVI